MPDSIGPPCSETLMIWSELAMLAKGQATSHHGMRCPRMESKSVKFLTSGVLISWSRSQHLTVTDTNDASLATNDARVVLRFLKELFSRFGAPKALISDRGTHLCNSQLDKALSRYGVNHIFSTPYHP